MDVLMSEDRSIQVLNRGAVLSDVSGIGGDIGRVLIHFFIGFEQLRSVNGVGTFFRQLSGSNVGDFVCRTTSVAGRERTRCLIPAQVVRAKIGDGRINICDSRGVLIHPLVGFIQLGAVYRVCTVRGQGAAARLVILLALPLRLALNVPEAASHNRASSVSVVMESLRLLILVVLVAISVVF
ncbi:Uncharacterised protein [Salmonella enterica subsp. enterica serovar Hartford]|nr:Uncharacterised protein [Salmonella enterica subsp. enterica serovar Hartford]